MTTKGLTVTKPGDVPQADAQATAEAIVPYFPDDSKKTTYLSYRACGFTVTEACDLTPVDIRNLRRWRRYDQEFKRLDTIDIALLRKSVGDSYLEMEFRRNFRLCLRLDYDVLHKHVKGDESLTKLEEQYLIKVRAHYTPQQLETLEHILGKGSDGDGVKDFNWTEWVLSMRGDGRELHMAGRRETG